MGACCCNVSSCLVSVPVITDRDAGDVADDDKNGHDVIGSPTGIKILEFRLRW